MKINYTNKTIELTKKEYREATVFGSDMYTALKEARIEFPTFKIITKEPPKKKSPIGRITYEFMKKYIEEHDNKEDNMKEFEELTGKSDNTEFKISACYGEVLEWFLIKYPAIKDYRKGIDEILNKARKEKIA